MAEELLRTAYYCALVECLRTSTTQFVPCYILTYLQYLHDDSKCGPGLLKRCPRWFLSDFKYAYKSIFGRSSALNPTGGAFNAHPDPVVKYPLSNPFPLTP